MIQAVDQAGRSNGGRSRSRGAAVGELAPSAQRLEEKSPGLSLEPNCGVEGYARFLASATPMQMVDIEKLGVESRLVKDLAKRLNLPASRVLTIIGVPKATAEKKPRPRSGRRPEGSRPLTHRWPSQVAGFPRARLPSAPSWCRSLRRPSTDRG